ncbi:hypothetical protein EIN_190570, partial [Entamoeba invadens IP1]
MVHIYQTEEKCLTCTSGISYVNSSGLCSLCDWTCSTCNTNGTCNGCSTNYVPFPVNNRTCQLCRSFDPNCDVCGDNKNRVCTSCDTNYYINAQNTCSQCDTTCAYNGCNK